MSSHVRDRLLPSARTSSPAASLPILFPDAHPQVNDHYVIFNILELICYKQPKATSPTLFPEKEKKLCIRTFMCRPTHKCTYAHASLCEKLCRYTHTCIRTQACQHACACMQGVRGRACAEARSCVVGSCTYWRARAE